MEGRLRTTGIESGSSSRDEEEEEDDEEEEAGESDSREIVKHTCCPSA
jgi:hypothetical protein